MTYQEQLQTPEWKSKRLVILERDKYRCTRCNCERTKFLGLSRSFGIKNQDQMKEAGYSVFKKLEDNKGVTVFYKNFLNVATFVGNPDSEVVLEKLKFALQWKKPESTNKYALGGNELICFLDDIKEGQKFADLNIHHKFYIIDKNAWEYDDNVLITLCSTCHKAEHERSEVFVYAKSGDVMYKAANCDRCGGSGYLPEFSYWQSGVCFGCNGHGVLLR